MTDINISELSVGDWVRVINQFDAQIDGYHSESGSLSLKTRQGNLVHYRLEDIHPIPLTPEILEKNGWNKIVRNIKYQTWVKGGIYIRKYSAEEWYRLFIGRFEMKFNLYHTHQLQNALRLAGMGKEIEV